MQNYLPACKIVSTHGVRGEMKALPRKRRIAAGSGQTVEDVNKLLRQFEAMQKMMKKVKRNPKGFMRGLGGMRGLR